jgi:uncharacterized protein YkwD
MLHSHARRQTVPARRSAWGARAAAVGTALAVSAIPSVAAADSASAATSSTAEVRTAVVKLTNVARVAAGCKELKVSVRLTKAAQGHAKDMAAEDYFSHTSADGRTWDQRIRDADWDKPAGENIAYGFKTSVDVLKGWMKSPGHKRNILNCKFRYIGIGYSADGLYWVQDFGY